MYVNETAQDVAAVVLEPIQGWGGSVVPPDDFMPLLRQWCDEKGILAVCRRGSFGHGKNG